MATSRPQRRRPSATKKKKATTTRKATAKRHKTPAKKHHSAPAHKKKVAKKAKKSVAPTFTPATVPGTQSPIQPPADPSVPAPPAPGALQPVPDPVVVVDLPIQGGFGRVEAERLLWRAGFGPRAGDTDRLVAMGLDAAVHSLVYPDGPVTLNGPDPYDPNVGALQPNDLYRHDSVWFLDRMVRSSHQLQERMTLIWHDWFATNEDKAGEAQLMMLQNDMFRRNSLGSFRDMLRDVTYDGAMLVWLDGLWSLKFNPNENYARELMELFTLGADRGAYTESDVRNLARAFTGMIADWSASTGQTNFRLEPSYHDTDTKTVFGQTGNWGIDDGWRMCLEHPMHPSFFVTKLWSYFIPTPPDASTQASLQALYTSNGYAIAPVVEAILKHPDLYAGPAMVKPPAVYAAGMLRALGRAIDTYDWGWLLAMAGQDLFRPPSVAGWDDTRWLDTSSWRGRWYMAVWALIPTAVNYNYHQYSSTESSAWAVENAMRSVGYPTGLSTEVRAGLREFADTVVPVGLSDRDRSDRNGQRYNALRQLILTCSDYQAC